MQGLNRERAFTQGNCSEGVHFTVEHAEGWEAKGYRITVMGASLGFRRSLRCKHLDGLSNYLVQ